VETWLESSESGSSFSSAEEKAVRPFRRLPRRVEREDVQLLVLLAVEVGWAEVG
jgi:hypothetical protein